MQTNTKTVVERKDLQGLFDSLIKAGYGLYGPTLGGNAIVYDRITSTDDLPVGWLDNQDNGSYRLSKDKAGTMFGFTVGPTSWKKFLYPPEKRLFEVQKDERRFKIVPSEDKPEKQAFIGVRSCELAAITIHDKVLTGGPYVDKAYEEKRENLFVVAVNCTRAGGTCFCSSMKTGPTATCGFDLALTEVIDGNRHYFVVAIGSETGAEVMNGLPHKDAGQAELQAAAHAEAAATTQMGRRLNTENLPAVLNRNFDNPHWNKVAARCLTCGNCTMVCPTCFCMNVEDTTELDGSRAERSRKWDSCFTVGFSYIHGGSIRTSTLARYRQWLMHKLAYWPDQFGTSGCVGCGRCITWCPVGIDLTEESRLIREGDKGPKS